MLGARSDQTEAYFSFISVDSNERGQSSNDISAIANNKSLLSFIN